MGSERTTVRPLLHAAGRGRLARLTLATLVLAALGAALAPAFSPAAGLASPRIDPEAIYARSNPGVVMITVVSIVNSYFGQREVESGGSGFVLDRQGDIVTNQHVVDGAQTITVLLSDGTEVAAEVVGADASTDVAVIRLAPGRRTLRPLVLGSSAKVRPGQSVVALGSPFGLSGTITEGIISGIGRTITAPDRTPITGALQTDAAINEGNSGGPLIDVTGKVIGLNAQINSKSGGNEGVGFAIPIDTVKKAVARLLAAVTGRVPSRAPAVGHAAGR
jgi:putative serine protease PepD